LRSAAVRRSATVKIVDLENSAEPAFERDHAESEDIVLRRRRVHDAIAALPSAQRQCIQLWLDGFKYDEISRALKTSPESVKTGLRDAKRHLRDLLASDGDDTVEAL
jgi:DNA-directed RNA polymerase specialized sigma24 family protein